MTKQTDIKGRLERVMELQAQKLVINANGNIAGSKKNHELAEAQDIIRELVAERETLLGICEGVRERVDRADFFVEQHLCMGEEGAIANASVQLSKALALLAPVLSKKEG